LKCQFYNPLVFAVMHKYDTCIRYDTYSTRWYVYFENNKIRYVIDTRYMNI